jgi:hypothetical protein
MEIQIAFELYRDAQLFDRSGICEEDSLLRKYAQRTGRPETTFYFLDIAASAFKAIATYYMVEVKPYEVCE